MFALTERKKELEGESALLNNRNIVLKRRKKEKHSSLVSKDTGLAADIQRLGKELKVVRLRNEDVICEMDQMKEEIAVW